MSDSPDATAPKATDATEPSPLQVVASAGGVVAKVGGSAIWAAGSYISNYALGERDARRRSGDGAMGQTVQAAYPAEAGDGTVRGLGSAEVLRIANALDGIFSSVDGAAKLRQPEVPRLVVVGGQSSGKSSLLNGLMAADILPLGEAMVTRAPLSLQLIHTARREAMRAEFGVFVDGVWRADATVALACPDPTPEQLRQIRSAIESQTEARAGSKKAVSSEAIYMRLYSPNVPNLSLVDLPGLTMTALTDQGQPRDIKAQIRQMISSYIRSERTIILMVCPARTDLEADSALELVKEHDPSGERTVGVLTKIDLMNAGTDVSNYLTNGVPADLQLAHGYFAVRNRSPAEAKSLSVRDGFAAEEAYFSGHRIYSGSSAACRERLGVPRLSLFLSRVLLSHLKAHMPQIVAEVNNLATETEKELSSLGPAVPSDEGSKGGMLQTLIADFSREFAGSLVERRPDIKTGRRIKECFVGMHASLRQVAPFNKSAFSDEALLEAVRDCEGNHLSFPIPPIELLEHLLNHPTAKPIAQLLPPCVQCLAQVHAELRGLCAQLLARPAFARFPQLQHRVREEAEAMLERGATAARLKLEELVRMEEAYIATDDPAFLNELSAVVKKLVNRMDATLLRSILNSYYATVVRSVSNAAPKAMMLFLVRASHESIQAHLFDTIGRQPPGTLLDEPAAMEARRRADFDNLAKLRAARRALESLG